MGTYTSSHCGGGSGSSSSSSGSNNKSSVEQLTHVCSKSRCTVWPTS